MGLILPQEVEIKPVGGALKYYEKLGYYMPKEYDNENRFRVPQGQTIKVSANDLAKGSNIKVNVKCDICGYEHALSYSKYNANIQHNNGKYICKNKLLHQQLFLDENYTTLVKQLKCFFNSNDRFPLYNEFTEENGLFTYAISGKIAKRKGKTLQQIMADIDCFKCSKPDIRYYKTYLNKYKDIIGNSKQYIGIYGVWNNYSKNTKNSVKLKLPRPDWFIENAPKDSNIHDMYSLMDWAGIYHVNPSKEIATKLIYEMQSKINHPLMYNDFRGNTYGNVSISTINKYWGSINKMKQKLGLEINQESMMDKHLSIQEIQNIIKGICNQVHNNEDRDIITMKDFKKYNSPLAADTISNRISKDLHITLTDYVNSLGYEFLQAGRGLNYTYKDTGEIVYSQFEYLFSNMLHELGLQYNIDYFKDVRYSDFINNYKYKSTCDYAIHYHNRVIYIEIAGIIEAYKFFYYDNKPIESSKSKEKYRKGLFKKEQVLKENNLEYYILFPCDLTKDNLNEILNNPNHDDVRTNISKFLQNNIDWVSVRNKGELKYITKKSPCGKREFLAVDC